MHIDTHTRHKTESHELVRNGQKPEKKTTATRVNSQWTAHAFPQVLPMLGIVNTGVHLADRMCEKRRNMQFSIK